MNGHELFVAVVAVVGSLTAALVLGLSLVACYPGYAGPVDVHYSYPQYGISGVIAKTGPYWHEGGPTQL